MYGTEGGRNNVIGETFWSRSCDEASEVNGGQLPWARLVFNTMMFQHNDEVGLPIVDSRCLDVEAGTSSGVLKVVQQQLVLGHRVDHVVSAARLNESFYALGRLDPQRSDSHQFHRPRLPIPISSFTTGSVLWPAYLVSNFLHLPGYSFVVEPRVEPQSVCSTPSERKHLSGELTA